MFHIFLPGYLCACVCNGWMYLHALWINPGDVEPKAAQNALRLLCLRSWLLLL